MRGTCGFPSLRQCVHASVLGCDTLDGKGIAERLGLNYQTFMSSVSGQPKHKLDADWLLPIMATTGSVEPLQFSAPRTSGTGACPATSMTASSRKGRRRWPPSLP